MSIFRSRTRSLLRRERIDGYLLILPWLLGFFLFKLGPMVASLAFSFMKYDIVTPGRWVGLANYGRLVRDDLFLLSLYNTAYYTFLSVPLGVVVALAAASLLNTRLRGLNVFRTIFYLPSVVPMVANTLLWMWIFNSEFGLANALFQWLGLPGQEWLLEVRLVKLVFIVMSLWSIGPQMVIFLAGLQGIPQSLYEAASLDGAGAWHCFRHVTLPLLSPVVFFNLVIGIISSFQVFTAAFIATDGGPQNASLFYVLYLYRNAFEFFKMGYASVLAWVLFLIVLIFTLIQFKMANLWVYYESAVRS